MDKTEARPSPFTLTVQEVEARSKKKKAKLKLLLSRKKKKLRESRTLATFESCVSDMSAVVGRVEVNGLVRTHDDLVVNIVKKMFEAQNVSEAMKKLAEVHQRLKSLGCFKRVDVLVDTDDDCPNHYKLTFTVEECNRLRFNVRTSASDRNGGCLVSGIVLRSPNLFGGGEHLEVSTSKNWSASLSEFNLLLSKNASDVTTLVAEVTKRFNVTPWTGLAHRLYTASVAIIYSPLQWLEQKISADCGIRHLFPYNARRSGLAFHAREDCGYSLKSSLSHELQVDTRDNRMMPTTGLLLKVLHELTGPIGNVAFLKRNVEAQVLVPIRRIGCSFSLGCTLGALTDTKLDNAHKGLTSIDALAPLTPFMCRGWSHDKLRLKDLKWPFQNEIVGSSHQVLLASSMKLHFPIPFLRGTDSWLFKTIQPYMFLDCGAMTRLRHLSVQDAFHHKPEVGSICWGLGVTIRLNDFVRGELHYAVPIKNKFSRENCSKAGLNFAIGLNFI